VDVSRRSRRRPARLCTPALSVDYLVADLIGIGSAATWCGDDPQHQADDPGTIRAAAEAIDALGAPSVGPEV
jgi:hypothetical protein